jgi:hypothetical protein
MVLLSAHHFLNYAQVAADELEEHCRAIEKRTIEKTETGSQRERESALVMPVSGVASA